ncbi:MAG: glycosyltransferase [Patescibacteria group bacterium]
MDISIIIPIYITSAKLLAMTKNCLDDLIIGTDGIDNNTEIIVVNDGSPNDNMVSILKNKYKSIKWLDNDKNIGFAGAINAGIIKSSKELVLLLNNDVKILDRKWLINLTESLKTNNWDLTSPKAGELDSNNEYVPNNNKNKYGRFRFQYLEAWCLLSKRRVYEFVGLFPTEFGSGFFEDALFCKIVQEDGRFKMGVSPNLGIAHFNHTTFSESRIDIPKQYNKNRKKYGEIIKHIQPYSLPKIA